MGLFSLTKGGILATIQAVAQIRSAGPSPAFAYPQVCCALLLIGDNKAVGRTQLSKMLKLGEGTIRTIIRHLSRANLVRSTKQGCALTPKGLSLYKRLRTRLSKTHLVDAGQLALDSESTALLVKRAAQRVKHGIEQRDAAVRAGAAGACTVLMKEGILIMPPGSDEWKSSLDNHLTKQLMSIFHPKQNDVIIIASANERTLSEYAAIAAGLTLLD